MVLWWSFQPLRLTGGNNAEEGADPVDPVNHGEFHTTAGYVDWSAPSVSNTAFDSRTQNRRSPLDRGSTDLSCDAVT